MKTIEDFVALVEAAPVFVPEASKGKTQRVPSIPDDRSTIFVDEEESRVVDEAVALLAAEDGIYQRGGRLVEIAPGVTPPRGIDRPPDAPRPTPIKLPRLREILSRVATWQIDAGEDIKRVHVPEWATKAVDARGWWPNIRPLTGIVEAPTLRKDGTILCRPGYDEDTGLLFQCQIDFPPPPSQPTRSDAAEACAILLDVVKDFPFRGPADRSAWLSIVITSLARYAFSGPAPLHLLDANIAGSGKSLLADVASMIATGRKIARTVLPKEDDELRKKILAIAIQAEPMILMDNIAHSLGGASLDAALTATSWSDRILGKSELSGAVPLYTVWTASGNNVVLIGDTGRRTLHIRLESPEEHPEERTDFEHADLLAWVSANRARLVMATLTIPSAYCLAGRPAVAVPAWGSFEDYSALVRASMVWAGLPDPAATRAELRTQSDREAAALRGLIAGWEEADPDRNGLTCSQALRLLADRPDGYEILRSAVAEAVPAKGSELPNAKSLAMKLHHLKGRVVAGKYFDKRVSNNTVVWIIGSSEAARPGTTGSTGSTTCHSLHACARTHAPAHAHARTGEAGSSPRSPLSPRGDSDAEEQEVAAWTG